MENKEQIERFNLSEKQEEMLKEIIRDFYNNLNQKTTRCWCCEWKYFILPFAWKYLSQNKDNICEDCQEGIKNLK